MVADHHAIVREGVFWGLAQAGDSRVTSLLRQAARNRSEVLGIRRAAAIGLGRSGQTNDIDYLHGLVGDTTEELAVRQAALAALALSQSGAAQSRVVAAMESDSHEIVVVAVVASRYIKSSDAVTGLLKVLKHRDSSARCLAARSLGERKEGQALASLRTLLNDDEPSVVLAAKEAIESIEGSRRDGIDGTVSSLAIYEMGIRTELFGPLQFPVPREEQRDRPQADGREGSADGK